MKKNKKLLDLDLTSPSSSSSSSSSSIVSPFTFSPTTTSSFSLKENKKKLEKTKKSEKTKKTKNTKKDDENENYEFEKLMEHEVKLDNYEKFSNLMNKVTEQLQEKRFFMKQTIDDQIKYKKQMKKILKSNHHKKPYAIEVLESTTIPEKYKYLVLNKIKTMESMEEEANGEYFKLKQWVDMFMKIPFGKINTLPINFDTEKETKKEKEKLFLQDAMNTLDKAVYGMKEAKNQFMQMLAQWITNPKSQGNAIALYGPPGIGKTSLVKEGIAKILNRPFAFIPLGGSSDVSFFTGHSYTFEGSIPGRIVNILMETQSMSPVFYFDELDKISSTSEHGQDVIGMLMHLIDGSQNEHFHDRYFSGIDFDLSKAMFIFSYNDDSKVHPILKDRMYRIECSGYSRVEKIQIARNFLIPHCKKLIGEKDDNKSESYSNLKITISDQALGYIIDNFTDDEKGVRNLKRSLETIYKTINLKKLLQQKINVENDENNCGDGNGSDGSEIKVTTALIEELLKGFSKETVFNFYS